jgi:hypothetical protein
MLKLPFGLTDQMVDLGGGDAGDFVFDGGETAGTNG